MAANVGFSIICRSSTTFPRLFARRKQCFFNTLSPYALKNRNSLCCSTSVTEMLQRPENRPSNNLERNEGSADGDAYKEHTQSGGDAHRRWLDTEEHTDSVQQSIRTESNDPTMHTVQDLSKFFTVDPTFISSLTMQKIARKEFIARAKALNECALIVREPALECLELIKCAVRKDLIATKALLYGKDGCGKSLTFAHALNACFNKDWFIICPIRPNLWRFHYKEVALSARKGGRVDLPQEAAEFLSSIKFANRNVFSKFGDSMRTRDTYIWSKREETPPNTSIEELIDYGIERPKYAADVVGALLKEVRLYSHEWPTSVVLAIDGVNGFFANTNMIVDKEKKLYLQPTGISMIHNLVKLMNADWKNGFMLLTVDANYEHEDHRASHQPRYLLTEAGFDALNPFVPIEVPSYSDEEINNALDYFVERHWIQHSIYRNSRQARKELIFLSAKNPLFLDNVIRSV